MVLCLVKLYWLKLIEIAESAELCFIIYSAIDPVSEISFATLKREWEVIIICKSHLENVKNAIMLTELQTDCFMLNN